jgi:hypothetical protein
MRFMIEVTRQTAWNWLPSLQSGLDWHGNAALHVRWGRLAFFVDVQRS